MQHQSIHQEDTIPWLSLLHLWLTNYLKERIAHGELDILMNGLSHLYNRTNMLYSSSLPALRNSMSGIGTQFIAPFDYDTWTQLRAVKRHIERIELLCHLLSGVTASVLEALGHLQIQEVVSSGEHSLTTSQETWDTALTTLNNTIEQWQHAYLEQPPFSEMVAERFTSPGALAQFDNACTLVLHSSSTIFHNILPDVQAIGRGDDEALATIFLDMTQHTDQILLQVGSLLEPLQMLIKQFALPSEIE